MGSIEPTHGSIQKSSETIILWGDFDSERLGCQINFLPLGCNADLAAMDNACRG